MKCLTLASVIAVTVLALAAPGAGARQLGSGPKTKPADRSRQLSKADAERAKKLYAQAVAFGRAGKYAKAQGPIREILELYARVLGKDHFETGDVRRELETLQKLAALPEAGRIEYMKTYVLSDQVGELSKKGRYLDAIQPAQQILDIYRRLLGPDSSYVAVAANQYGVLLNRVERHKDAEAQFRQALRIAHALLGEEHSATAALYGNLAYSLEKQGKFTMARRLQEKALSITIRLRGERHTATAIDYNNQAGQLDRQALYADAERLYRKAVDILRTTEGPDSNKLATSCNNLALNLQHQGKYDEAERLYQEALRIRLKLWGEDHPDTGEVYMNLATNREARGDIAAAERLYRETLRTYRKAYGSDHSYTAWVLNNLAVNLDKQARHTEAEQLLRDALAIVLRSPEHQSRAVAIMSNNLASCLQAQEKYKEAEALCTHALSILRDLLGPDHPSVAVAVNNVAANLDAQEKYPEAERYLREALATLKRRYGDRHPETAEGRDNLGVNLYHQGRFEEADRLFKEALTVQQRVLGEGHPSTARTYKLLILNSCARGAHPQAAALAAAATKSFEAARRRISFAGLDRARSTADVSPYPALATVAARGRKPAVAWRAFEQNLGRGLLDDLAAHPLSAKDRHHEQELLERLEELDRQVLAAPARPGASAQGPSADELHRQRDVAQAEFAAFQAGLAARYGVAAGEVYDLSRIQAQLPDDAALLAWVDLSDQAKRMDTKGDHWACLVRQRGAPVWVRLVGTGPGGAWTDEDEQLPIRVRRAFISRPASGADQWKALVHRLALQRLAPVEEHLRASGGQPAIRHLIVLPSHQMARVPVETLTDRFTVSYAPSGTMFAWLQERRAMRKEPEARLLALGDPTFQLASNDHGNLPKDASPRSRPSRAQFAPLPGTRQEISGIARVFRNPNLLIGSRASEQNLDQLAASGSLGEFRYLHFATHAVLDEQRPLHSALILAQDQVLDPLMQVRKGKEFQDGRLTAERILQRWKLNADLVTLSACDTGLGRYAGGEGYIGFSQALFLAGAQSMVLSLWPVDDAATALLMTRFYENLRGMPDGTVKPMPRALALAEAKRWLRNLGPEAVRQLTKDLSTRGTRGRVEPRKPAERSALVHNYEHPYYWSGFILIGDPR